MITVSAVANASRTNLLCITYEILLDKLRYISDNVDILKSKDIENKESIKKLKESIIDAIGILKMLAGDLNFEFDISNQLFSIYVYVQGILIKNKTKEGIEEAYSIIHKIYEPYKVLANNEEGSAPSINNAEQVYTGLTYDQNKLSETYIKESNRGYMA